MEKVKFVFRDGSGEDEFFVLEETKINGAAYILVSDSEDDDGECLILKEVEEESQPESVYEIVEDETELAAVSKVFEELLEDELKEKGLKVTHQRLKVLSVLEQNSGVHMTAEDVYELVSQECPEIGLATVYRTLQLLWEIQLVDRINLDDGCVRYEIGHLIKGDAKHNHHHLICRACGRVIPFADDLLDDLEHHIEEATGFHVLDHELKFYGLCRECRGKKA